MLRLYVKGSEILIKKSTFPAGETMISIQDSKAYVPDQPLAGMIHFNFESNGELIDLLLLTDAIRRFYRGIRLSLRMAYVPYARQDRVCNDGESLSIKVITDLINSQNYHSVTIYNAHSDVTPALINNVYNASLVTLASNLDAFCYQYKTVLVSPDAGANKKVFDFAMKKGYNDVVRADKTRDVATGKITGTVVYSEHVGDKDFLILDDICDGGYTFLKLAEELRKLTTGKIYLYVTHGIFSKGYEELTKHFDTIFVSNLMNKPNPIIKELE